MFFFVLAPEGDAAGAGTDANVFIDKDADGGSDTAVNEMLLIIVGSKYGLHYFSLLLANLVSSTMLSNMNTKASYIFT